MRYREDGANPDYPYSESMHQMLSLTMVMGIIIGCALLWMGIRGKVLWLKVWSVGLILCSIAYLVADTAGLV